MQCGGSLARKLGASIGRRERVSQIGPAGRGALQRPCERARVIKSASNRGHLPGSPRSQSHFARADNVGAPLPFGTDRTGKRGTWRRRSFRREAGHFTSGFTPLPVRKFEERTVRRPSRGLCQPPNLRAKALRGARERVRRAYISLLPLNRALGMSFKEM